MFLTKKCKNKQSLKIDFKIVNEAFFGVTSANAVTGCINSHQIKLINVTGMVLILVDDTELLTKSIANLDR